MYKLFKVIDDPAQYAIPPLAGPCWVPVPENGANFGFADVAPLNEGPGPDEDFAPAEDSEPDEVGIS